MNSPHRNEESWQQFFREDYLHFGPYLRTPEQTTQTVEGIVNMLQLPGGSKVLDLCCGLGRLTFPLAEAGYDMIGVDGAPVLIKHAQEKATNENYNIWFQVQDARDITFDEEFDAVLNMGGAFGYVEKVEDDQLILHNMARSLKHGGKLLMEVFSRDGHVRGFKQEPFERPFADTSIRTQFFFNTITGRWGYELQWTVGQEKKVAKLDFRLYVPSELIKMVQQAGLKVLGIFQDWDCSEPTPFSTGLLLLAGKE